MSIPTPDPVTSTTAGAGAVRRDEGSALIMTLMVLALLTALSTTVAVVTINNLQSSMRAQHAGVALNAAEAGVAQALSYLRSSGTRAISCSPTCATNPWGNEATPKAVAIPGPNGAGYEVWVEKVVPHTPTAEGSYRIHSLGKAAQDAARRISVDVTVSTTTVPKGVFARTVNGGGSASVQRVSIISTGCVYNRSKIQMEGIDPAYGIPAAVHSSQVITDSNGSGQYCPTTKKPIHDPSKTGSARYCNPAYPYDQDRFGGGDLGAGACGAVKSTYPDYYGQKDLNSDTFVDVDGSFIKDDAALLTMFGMRTPALSQAQLDRLRTVAQSQGNYHLTATPPVGGWSPDEDHAVLFFDLAKADPGGLVDLNKVNNFGRDPLPAVCPDRSLIIVIDGGNARLNSNQKLAASLFLTSTAPYGQVLKVNGTSDFIGTIVADSLDLTGNTNVSMDECFVNNLSPALLNLTPHNYVEHDR